MSRFTSYCQCELLGELSPVWRKQSTTALSVASPSGHLGITIIDVKQREGGITLSF